MFVCRYTHTNTHTLKYAHSHKLTRTTSVYVNTCLPVRLTNLQNKTKGLPPPLPTFGRAGDEEVSAGGPCSHSRKCRSGHWPGGWQGGGHVCGQGCGHDRGQRRTPRRWRRVFRGRGGRPRERRHTEPEGCPGSQATTKGTGRF